MNECGNRKECGKENDRYTRTRQEENKFTYTKKTNMSGEADEIYINQVPTAASVIALPLMHKPEPALLARHRHPEGTRIGELAA
jgi:hypothetical protein